MVTLDLNGSHLTISILRRIAEEVETNGSVVIKGGAPNLQLPVTGWLDAVINGAKARKRAKS